MDYMVLDTNVASLSVKGELPASLTARLLGTTPVVTFVTVGELTKWAEMRNWSRRRRGALDHWISQRLIIGGDEHVSRLWGRLSAAAARRGRPRPDNDTWIAACCLAEGLPLLTRNVKDFVDFADEDGLALVQP
jgi:predicted nucleic acid-binding protein